MTLPRVQISARRVRLHPALFAVFLVIAALTGALVADNLPFGSKRLTYAYGTAHVKSDGSGTFMIEKGSGVLLPAHIVWADRGGNITVGGRPACLKGDEDGQAHGVPVEAGYLEVRLPDGKGSYPMVGWIRCL
ncbi:hypothetical protein [Microtetraspora sp. NBRC 16547]|uniref:hypothetical protein n=1 Tax=Microtetraspora sp. NBRC 16547 TaxID=3030993 RepID=UPI0024A5C16E|nr:hypothetical protein [Microtetraspora sp. NBRC 16547]GLX00971.1 hypothetical protein Misp02_50570 [Microtetraspora sp. NBRC 16547]